MTRPRWSIGGMMAVVVIAAVGLAALRSPSETWAGGMLLLTCGILALAVVGAVTGRGARRTGWLGFTLFGWGYLALSGCGEEHPSFASPTARLIEIVGGWFEIPLHPRPNPFCGYMSDPSIDARYAQIGHCLWALVAASLGGLLAGVFFGSSASDLAVVQAELDATASGWNWRLPLTIAGLVTLILFTMIATLRSGPDAPLWASVTFGLTCAFIGLVGLGAILGRGRRRAIWLGAALLGAVYTASIFSRPIGRSPRTYLALDPIMKGLQAPLAPVARRLVRANASILDILDRPIPMRLPQETTLAEVLEFIKRETATSTYSGIPIYVDPIGLQEAERTMNSTVQIDLEGVPLKATLGLCLKQLGLVYAVEQGYLRITSEDQEYRSPHLEDPGLIVGHCLLSLLAVGFGAVVAPLVAGAGREPHGPRSGSAGDDHST